jgi:hypothetical protein
MIGRERGPKSRFILMNTLLEILSSNEQIGLFPLRDSGRDPFQEALGLGIIVFQEDPAQAQKGPCVVRLALQDLPIDSLLGSLSKTSL